MPVFVGGVREDDQVLAARQDSTARRAVVVRHLRPVIHCERAVIVVLWI